TTPCRATPRTTRSPFLKKRRASFRAASAQRPPAALSEWVGYTTPGTSALFFLILRLAESWVARNTFFALLPNSAASSVTHFLLRATIGLFELRLAVRAVIAAICLSIRASSRAMKAFEVFVRRSLAPMRWYQGLLAQQRRHTPRCLLEQT